MNLTVTDIVAIVVIVGCFIMIGMGKGGVLVPGILLVIIGFYFSNIDIDIDEISEAEKRVTEED